MSDTPITPDPATTELGRRRPPRPQLGGPPRPVVASVAGAQAADASPPPPTSDRSTITIDRRVVAVAGALAVLVAALVTGLLLSHRHEHARTTAPAPAAAPQHTRSAAPAHSASAATEPATPAPSGATADTAPSATAPKVTTSAFSLSPPAGWIRDAREKDHGSYVESRWHLAGSPEVFVLIDHTAGYDGTAVQGARSVRAMTSRSAGYHELAFAPTSLAGTSAWRWEFQLGDVRKVDWFLTGCGTGYALLGAAPAARWSDYSHQFAAVARSLQPAC